MKAELTPERKRQVEVLAEVIDWIDRHETPILWTPVIARKLLRNKRDVEAALIELEEAGAVRRRNDLGKGYWEAMR